MSLSLEEIVAEIVRLPVAEQVGLSNVLSGRLQAASASGINKNRKTTAAEIDDALASTPGCNANLRRAVVGALMARGILADDPYSDKVSAAASGRKTIASIMASNPRAQSGLKLIMAQARRLGFEIKQDEPVSLVALDAALAGKNLDERFRLKIAMKSAGLI